jgi:hypothetical protein
MQRHVVGARDRIAGNHGTHKIRLNVGARC